MSETLLTIIVPATPARFRTSLPPLVGDLEVQCAADPRAEFIVLLDPYRLSIGEKLNWLVAMAAGKFVATVADDDRVTSDYVSTLLETIEQHPDADVICYDTDYHIADKKTGKLPARPTYVIKESKDYRVKDTKDVLYRLPSDKMAWRTEFRMQVPNVHTNDHHDMVFSTRAKDFIGKEIQIGRSLYKFYYNPASEIGGRFRRELDSRPARPTRYPKVVAAHFDDMEEDELRAMINR